MSRVIADGLSKKATATTQEAEDAVEGKYPDAAGVHAAFGQFGLGVSQSRQGIDISGGDFNSTNLVMGAVYSWGGTPASNGPAGLSTHGHFIPTISSGGLNRSDLLYDRRGFSVWFRMWTYGTPRTWQRIYTTGNILGTVSQSAGVPTGAIIESGSNANGHYIKWADGTMICIKNQSGTSGPFAELAITFAATFTTIDSAGGTENGTGIGNNLGSGQYLSIRNNSPLPTPGAIINFNLQSGYQQRLISTAYQFTFMATGRWY